MKKMAASHAILALVLSVLTATALGQEVVLGVLEDSHGWYAGEPNFRAVRVVFRKVGLDWEPFPSDCPDQQCLRTVSANYPHEMKWTITFDGKNLGQITSYAPSEFKWYAAIGQQQINGTSHVPTVGKQSSEFGGYTGAAVHRPLVANSQPFFRDPESWKPAHPSGDLVALLRKQFRKKFPEAMNCENPDENVAKPWSYRDEDVKIFKSYSSRKG